ncbi:MAG: YihY/virulence factor BrkB family protein [Proteobacteria bacterium]|nr:YihY/virulence factor BrkB family protein [Pseudomonadota bacterium]MCP4921385.1 YihY/virulence factor BrkB family protein [Pseudomonadota bacterium]
MIKWVVDWLAERVGVLGYLITLGRSARKHEIIDRAAQMAYFLLFAVFPFLVALLGLLSWFDLADEIQALETLVADAFPAVVGDLIVGEVHRIVYAEASGRIIIGLVVSIYSSQRAIAAAIRGVNAAWGAREGRNFFVRRGIGLVITVATMASSVVALLLMTLGTVGIELASDQGWIEPGLRDTLTVLRWPIVLLMLHGIINLLYRFGANTPMTWSWSTWGSLFATSAIVLVTLVFQFYANQIADLGATYGSLGAAIGLLLYFYLLGQTILIGAEIDALNWRRKSERERADPNLLVQ